MKEFEEMDELKKDLFEAIDNICQHYANSHKKKLPVTRAEFLLFIQEWDNYESADKSEFLSQYE